MVVVILVCWMVAIGEIGLDFFVKEIASGEARDKQERYYAAQLDLAAEFGLPVLLHVRRSQDIVLNILIPGGQEMVPQDATKEESAPSV